MSIDSAADYIRETFQPSDRLAVVLLNKRTTSVIQRLATATRIAGADFQSWLRHQNGQRNEIYISMNALRDDARGRTKADVAAIRHVYLDVDDDGTAAVEKLLKREDMPKPNYLINTSRDKWQVVWRVAGFAKLEAEELQKGLARDTGSDPAATDCARVLRLPGFYNYKYSQPHLVRAESYASATYRPEHFPKISSEHRRVHDVAGPRRSSRQRPKGKSISQSERDWAYALRALAHGESPDIVMAAIASHRRYDKHDPKYYAEITVRKAYQEVQMERSQLPSVPKSR